VENITLHDEIYAQLKEAKAASLSLSLATTDQKNSALLQMADQIWLDRHDILSENALDIQKAQTEIAKEKIDRLLLTERRILEIVEGLRQVAELDDPVGEVCDHITRPNQLSIDKVRVPLGVIAIIYESRPNVTVDAAGLAIKTGNAVVLRGGKEAFHSNFALVRSLRTGMKKAGQDARAIQFVTSTDRDSVDILVRARGLVDLAIPRGGAGLINRVVGTATVPVIETGVGNCHVYVDKTANRKMATDIVVNAKVQRPSVCNAAETLLVHRDLAEDWLPECVTELLARGVEVRACANSWPILQKLVKDRQNLGSGTTETGEATETGVAAKTGEATESGKTGVVRAETADFETEFLNLTIAVKLVDSVEDAIHHIAEYGTKHSESIVSEDAAAANKFLTAVDAAVVYHNASTRFTDGFEFGFGSEIGISTQKLHARGPMGIRELTSYKYVVHGSGQVR
jgi:glutamate-5-semialdehyde dehydrogenase